MFLDLEVKITLLSSLNTCKGVVPCPYFKECSEQDILENMKEQGVTAVRRIKFDMTES